MIIVINYFNQEGLANYDYQYLAIYHPHHILPSILFCFQSILYSILIPFHHHLVSNHYHLPLHHNSIHLLKFISSFNPIQYFYCLIQYFPILNVNHPPLHYFVILIQSMLIHLKHLKINHHLLFQFHHFLLLFKPHLKEIILKEKSCSAIKFVASLVFRQIISVSIHLMTNSTQVILKVTKVFHSPIINQLAI